MKYFKSKHPLCLFIISLVFSSCAHLLHVEKAQNAFNKAATIENEAKLDFMSMDTEPAALPINKEIIQSSPRTYYKLAYAELNQALGSKGKLKSDDVLGTVYALKALCEWKLGDYTKARTTADDALIALRESDIRSPRDEAIMAALPGIIDNDLAYDALANLKTLMKLDGSLTAEQALSKYGEVKDQFKQFIFSEGANNSKLESAFSTIDNAKTKISPKHNLQQYFIMAQMACLKNWRDGLSDVLNFTNKVSSLNPDKKEEIGQWYQDNNTAFKDKRKMYLEEMEKTLGSDNTFYKEWKRKLGVRN